MSIDLSQFYQVFFEEAAEHLENMEKLLLNIDIGSPAIDDLNAVFRVAHSIKGGAATFGFEDLKEVTHVLESHLDKLRRGEASLRDDLVDIFLRTGDVLSRLLEAHRQGSPAEDGLAQGMVAELLALNLDDAPSAQGAAPKPAAAPAHKPDSLAIDPSWSIRPTVNHYRVRLFSIEDATSQVLLEDWARIGTVAHLAKTDSELTFRFDTTLYEDELREMLLFVCDENHFDVERIGGDDGFVDEGEGYGVFLDQPGASNAAVSHEGDGWGFFEPIAPKAPEKTDASAARGDDPGYGFFEPEPAAPMPEAKSSDDEQGYGFFTPVGQAASANPVNAKSQVVVAPAVKMAASATAAVATPAKPAAQTDASIRVSVEKVDLLINLVGELVITQSMISSQVLSPSGEPNNASERMLVAITQLERNSRDLQEAVMSIRMMPISFVFSRFPRMARDLAAKLGKQIELRTVGENTELDKGLIEKVADPLTHLVRNSIDHGIELPEVRKAAGKSEKGTVTLEASHQGGNVVIQIYDDGKGLDRERILRKAQERGLPVSDNMPDQEVWQLIFAPGFSTADQVTEVSGRGVGMDVVKRNVEALGGRIELDSAAGLGTRTTIRLPLTLAILDGMIIAVGSHRYILPLSFIVESLQPKEGDVRTISGSTRVLHVRGEYLPFISLAEIFGIQARSLVPQESLVIVLDTDGQRIAMQVDELLGQQQAVIKSLESNYRRVPGLSGATIMGDGRVAMILDVAALVRLAQKRPDGTSGGSLKRIESEELSV